MVSFELDEEIKKFFFFVLLRVWERKNSESL